MRCYVAIHILGVVAMALVAVMEQSPEWRLEPIFAVMYALPWRWDRLYSLARSSAW